MFAVADYFPEVARKVGEELGTAPKRQFSGLSGCRKLIESGVEAVALETPPCFFPEHARHAVDAGLHVYMAKPVAVDAPGCLAVEQAANDATAHGRCFFVDYQLPTDPHNRAIVDMIEQGELGKVVTLNSHYYAGTFPDPPMTATLASRLQNLIWVNDIPLGASYHVNACIHAVDAALWVLGARPVRAVGLGYTARPNPHGDSHDVYSILFEFPDGRCLNHRGKHLHNQTGFDVACEVQGEVGFAEIRYGGKAFLKSRLNGYSGEVQNLYEAGAVRNIASFHQQVCAGDASNTTVRRSIDGALTTILGREAARQRGAITLAQLIQENRRLEIDRTGLVN
jgi:predicted dehydrogenase